MQLCWCEFESQLWHLVVGKNPNERGVWGLEAKKYKLANSEMKALEKVVTSYAALRSFQPAALRSLYTAVHKPPQNNYIVIFPSLYNFCKLRQMESRRHLHSSKLAKNFLTFFRN